MAGLRRTNPEKKLYANATGAYEAAWEECTRNDRAGVLDEDACKRASDAWHELVAYVVRMVV